MQLHLEEAMSRPSGFMLLLIDIDHFKQINDTHGHNTGDTVLRELSSHLSANLGNDALLGRWGGEEFLVLLPRASYAELEQLAEDLLERVRQQSFAHGFPLTLSIGGALSSNEARPEDVVHRADTALYQAKEAGRNRFRAHLPSELKQAA
jgi:two-component system cell cycle response regulator